MAALWNHRSPPRGDVVVVVVPTVLEDEVDAAAAAVTKAVTAAAVAKAAAAMDAAKVAEAAAPERDWRRLSKRGVASEPLAFCARMHEAFVIVLERF